MAVVILIQNRISAAESHKSRLDMELSQQSASHGNQIRVNFGSHKGRFT